MSDNFHANNDGEFQSFQQNFITRFFTALTMRFLAAKVMSSLLGFWAGVRFFCFSPLNTNAVSDQETEDVEAIFHNRQPINE